MLKEYKYVRQIEGEAKRRWFTDEYFDLIVWFDYTNNTVLGFQLCYDIAHKHRALTWQKHSGYTHHRVDDGENRPGKMKATPILVADGLFEYHKIAEEFKKASKHLEKSLSEFIYDKLVQYPKYSL